MKLLIPLFFALAHGSCYDYEYYDPGTGASLPGNACAAQAAKAATAASGTAVVGQAAPQTFGASTTGFAAAAPATSFGASTTSLGATSYGASTIVPPTYGGLTSTPSYGVAAAPMYAASTPVYSSAPAAVYTSAPAGTLSTTFGTPVYGTSTISGAVYGASTISAPVYGATVAAVRSPAVSAQSAASSQQLSPELQYYKQLGEKQAEQHKRNTRIVNQAAKDLSKSSLVNTLVAGSGHAAPFYPAVRLSYQKKVANAYKSEKNIAEKNANDAYQRYQQDPSRVNLLVSKYQDLNADLRDAAYHYNIVNSGTFGQQIATTSFLGIGGSLINTVSQVVTQRQQTQDLQDIQRQMQRVQRQLQVEVQAAAQQQKAGTTAAVPVQGSVQQRMMAMSVYGPAQRG